ncbi:DNA cytosine methyltransferase [Rhizobium leguminosarum]|uniref:DNA cytosine methyltransferase n=1 Tax=Rhizobium leguminosarum TaxID=384 RepID=UPI001ECDF375|nr:DNA cytosine methyltransferase [Rhizobium leguminosarum]MBY5738160.1 DNA cytosine methyltransferase [Rhizobium leguminosarum]
MVEAATEALEGARPTAIDLFCGAGGLTLGLKLAGFNVLAGVELENAPAATFIANHPDVSCFQKDIRHLGAAELRATLQIKRGDLDLLAGCPPCQGFSSLRTRRKSLAVQDDRNDLLFEFLRFVEALFPKVIMMENVPALASDARIKVFLHSLTRLGYKVGRRSVRIEDAADYGVPQRRFRMILVASRIGRIEVPTKTDHVTVRKCLEAARLLPIGKTGDPLHDFLPKRSMRVQEVIAHIPKDGGSRTALPDRLVLPCHKGRGSGFRDVYGRLAWDTVAPTITGGCGNPSKGRYLHPEEDRAITLREAALLQSFPSDYYFDLSKGRERVALMIGNALPPEFIRRHAAKICEALLAK